MKRDVRTARPEETAQSAARTMREASVGLLPVCEPNRRVVGVVTDRDLATRACAEDLPASSTPVAYVMTRGVVACRAEDPVARAEALMREHRITRIVVMDEESILAGILSLSDLAFYEPPARMGRTLRCISARKYGPESCP